MTRKDVDKLPQENGSDVRDLENEKDKECFWGGQVSMKPQLRLLFYKHTLFRELAPRELKHRSRSAYNQECSKLIHPMNTKTDNMVAHKCNTFAPRSSQMVD